MKRDPAAVLEDVRQGKVSVERVRSVYGVAIENKRRFASNHDLSPLHLGQLGVERIAQPVTEQVE